nr:MAG TPA: hypothetical protein [Bacteriophage sp.]
MSTLFYSIFRIFFCLTFDVAIYIVDTYPAGQNCDME